uniref:hypothetical protein n=1 Tax=Pseudonocardia sp. CA-138482 TaxID=3240023 RepID=UPI003F49AEB5
MTAKIVLIAPDLTDPQRRPLTATISHRATTATIVLTDADGNAGEPLTVPAEEAGLRARRMLTQLTGSINITLAAPQETEVAEPPQAEPDVDAQLSAQMDRLVAEAARTSWNTLADARDNLVGKVERERLLEDYLVFDVVAAETTHQLWGNVLTYAENKKVNLLAAVAGVAREEQRRLLNGRFASRSTAVLSNALEDVRRETVARWLRELCVTFALATVPA